VALQPAGLRVSLYYLFGYMLMSLGAFAVIAALQRQGEPGDELETYEGLYARKPWLTMLLAFFFLALAGMPPTVGMTGKLLLVGGGLQAGAGWLVAALVVSTAISAYAYLRVVLAAFRTAGAAVVAAAGSSVGVASGEAVAGAEEESGEWSFAWADIGLGVVFALTVAGVLALGLLPETFLTALEGLLPPR